MQMIIHQTRLMCLDALMSKLECATKCAIDRFGYNGMNLNSSKCKLCGV